MNAEYIQNLRYKLQKRFRKLNSETNEELFHYNLIQFWNFIESELIFKDILDDLLIMYPDIELEINLHTPVLKRDYLKNELEHTVGSILIIKECLINKDDNEFIEFSIGNEYKNYENNDSTDGLEYFKNLFVEPVYEYLDEQLDDQRVILNILRRYKHKCEWFKREYLYNLAKENSSIAEKKLAYHLYEYLYDQGIEFNIEPKSASGSPDLISVQNTDDPLIADTKIFDNNGRNKSYLSKGFRQVYQYTLDYNEPFGYLIIYKICENDLKFSLKNQTMSTPFIIHNNKTIFIITIDIFEYNETASKRGKLKSIEITEEDLVKITQNEEN